MSDDTLSDAVRRVVKRGGFSHLSLASSGNLFKAAFRGVDHKDHQIAENSDPVAALIEALTGRRMPVAKLQKPKREPAKRAEFDELLG